MTLKIHFEKILNEYRSVYEQIWKSGTFSHPLLDYFNSNVKNAVQESVFRYNNSLIVSASTGIGKTTKTPWIAILDPRIASKASSGTYIVYLFNKDKKKMYLALECSIEETKSKIENLGITGSGKTKKIDEVLAAEKKEILGKIRHFDFRIDDSIETGKSDFDKTAFLYKCYTLEAMPADEELERDLANMMQVYQDYYENCFMENNITWLPSTSEYDPNITKEKWLEILNNPKIFDDKCLLAMACMYDNGGSGSCTGLAYKYNQWMTLWRTNCGVHLAGRIAEETGCEIAKKEDGSNKYFVIPFLYRKASKGEQGSFVYRLRPELYDALGEFDILRYLPNLENELEGWEPSIEEYDPGVSKDQWLEMLNNEKLINDRCKSYLALYFDNGGSATLAELEEKYHIKGDSIKQSLINLLRYKIVPKIQCPIYDQEDAKYWPIMFVGKKAGNDQQGNYIWKLRLEFAEALGEFDILRFLPNQKEQLTIPVSTKDAINQIKSYIAAKGFAYDDGLIENFYLSLKSKPFVILAGTSGTGKTRLAKLFAEAIGAEFKLVPVRPDWSDSSDLFGHVDLNGTFIPGPVIDFIANAQNNPEKPYILCLDEMNLARVEYYLSDVLSVIETRDLVDGEIVTDPLIDMDRYGGDNRAKDKYGLITFPQNLYLVGTVNMDETTFPFSKKVLDRANTIEFNYVNLTPDFSISGGNAEAQNLHNDFLKTEYLQLSQCSGDKEAVEKICQELQGINEILKKAIAHVGYRVRDEIAFYLLNNTHAGNIIDENAAMDNEIMQKILPRIQGSSTSIQQVLEELLETCKGAYPQCEAKIRMMLDRYNEDGFTSYWL